MATTTTTTTATATAIPPARATGAGLRGPLVSITHGGGPMPLLGNQPELVEIWAQHVARVIAPARPDAIVLISAHYHSKVPKVLGAARPRMIFDYGGFPPEAYQYAYPAPGHPALAARIVDAMRRMSILADAVLDTEWGFDHGSFVPLISMLPHASIPIVPVSVSATDDAAVQLAIGDAIRAALMPPSGCAAGANDAEVCQGERADAASAPPPSVAVIASGSAFHNFAHPRGKPVDDAFDRALRRLLTDKNVTPAQRREGLLRWRELPGAATYQHPAHSADHMMPLLSLAAVAGYAPASEVVQYATFGAQSTDFIWR